MIALINSWKIKWGSVILGPTRPRSLNWAHQNRTIAIASDFRVDGAKSPEIPQKEGVLGSETATRNRKSLATFHRTLNWAPANGGVTNGGLIGLFSPFSAFFALFRRVRRASGKSGKRRKKAFFLRYPQICLSPHLLNPHLRHSNLNRNAKSRRSLAISGVRDGHRNHKSQKSLPFRCAKMSEWYPQQRRVLFWVSTTFELAQLCC